MANATVFQDYLMGIESTPGTPPGSAGANVNKRITGTAFQGGPVFATRRFRPNSRKFATAGGRDRAWAAGKLSGDLQYTEIEIWLRCLLNQESRAGTTPYAGVYKSKPAAPDAFKTFTAQFGADGTLIHTLSYAFLTGMQIDFGLDGAKFSADVVAGKYSHVSTPFSGTSITTIPLSQHLMPHSTATLTSTSANIATALVDTRSAMWRFTDRARGVWFLGNKQFQSHVETPPKLEGSLTLEATEANMAFADGLEAGTVYFSRIQNTLDSNNQLRIDTGWLVTNVSEPKDDDGVQVIEISLEGVENGSIDGTDRSPFKITVTNAQTTTTLGI